MITRTRVPRLGRDKLQSVYLGSSQQYILVSIVIGHNNLSYPLSYVTDPRSPDNFTDSEIVPKLEGR